MKIYGAGMAGLLAANMLRRYEPEVHELQKSLPYNHGALLRFRSDAVARATGQPFTQVRVHKSLLWNGNLVTNLTLQMANAYSFKVTGRVLPRSIMNLEPVDRWIAPPDFIEKMTKGINIIFDSPMTNIGCSRISRNVPVISTIPMPTLMDLVGWEDRPIFPYAGIISATVTITDPIVDVYQTIYGPNERTNWYRASITGNILTLEYTEDFLPGFMEMPIEELAYNIQENIGYVLFLFGLGREAAFTTPVVKKQKFGKLRPIDDKIRRSFILGMTRKYGIYSLGRFATWRQILLDDIVKDVNVIDGFIQDETEYSSHLGSI